MGILTVTQALDLIEREEKLLVKTCLTAHIRRDMRIVESSMGIRLCREFQTRLRECVSRLADFGKYGVIIRRIADHGDIAEILCRTAEHRRTAYVDILHGILHAHTLFGNSCLERIEIHAHHLDCLDSVCLKLRHMVGDVAATEKTAMHLRMKGLHTTVADFRETCDIADVDNVNAALAKPRHCAAGGDYLPTEFLQGTGKLHHSPFIAYTY
ncbi:hypothetical protein IMSAGC016_01627 [Muribaculaceae bacterium]|nr:hypothetical protein IMSAGC016_01627 [Muribaculaceae bacterium]